MTSIRVMAIVSLATILGTGPIFAQTPFEYRGYALGSSVASVAKLSGTREDGIRTLHERPARIQELDWRAPYVPSGTALADPVRGLLFSFYDDQLYKIVVSYDADRMEGLTHDDLIETISATYGVPLLRHARAARKDPMLESHTDTSTVAQWEDAVSQLTLTKGIYSMDFALVLISKSLNARATAAIKEALRLDAREAPQRERDQRAREVADARVASQKARVVNKAAFKP